MALLLKYSFISIHEALASLDENVALSVAVRTISIHEALASLDPPKVL